VEGIRAARHRIGGSTHGLFASEPFAKALTGIRADRQRIKLPAHSPVVEDARLVRARIYGAVCIIVHAIAKFTPSSVHIHTHLNRRGDGERPKEDPQRLERQGWIGRNDGDQMVHSHPGRNGRVIVPKGRGDLPSGVLFPDIPGCTTAGDTANQASERAKCAVES
jgi:hypothetical protein